MKKSESEFRQNRVSSNIEIHVQEQLDKLIDNYDSDTLDRLATARNAALDAIPLAAERPSLRERLWSKTTLGITLIPLTCCALIVTLVIRDHRTSMPQSWGSDLEILTEVEDLDMLSRDPEFYLWLEAEMAMPTDSMGEDSSVPG